MPWAFPCQNYIFSEATPEVTTLPFLELGLNGTFYQRGRMFNQTNWFQAKLTDWPWWKHALPQFLTGIVNDQTTAVQYTRKSSGLVPLYANARGDFLYVPIRFATPFCSMTNWLVRNKVFLEVATPTLVGSLQEQHGAVAKFVDYCMAKSKRRKQYTEWITKKCNKDPSQRGGGNWYYPSRQKPSPPYGFYHPIKLSVYPLEVWDETFWYINGISIKTK